MSTLRVNSIKPRTGSTVTITENNTLAVTGVVSVTSAGSLEVAGSASVGGAATITGSVDVQGTLKANTLTPLTGNTVTIPSGQFVNVGGGLTVTNAGSFTVSGPTAFESGATVTGVVTFSQVDLNSDVNVSGIVTASSFSGDGSGLSNVSPFNWATKSANYTASAKDGLFINTSAGIVTVTLPPAPAAGDYIHFLDLNGTFATNNLVINRNGKNIIGAASDLTVDINNSGLTLVYTDTTNGWKLMYF